jgi:hypothetical protein
MAPPGPPPKRGPGRPPGPSSKPPIRPNITRIQLGNLQPPGSSPKGKSSLLSPKAAYVERMRSGEFGPPGPPPPKGKSAPLVVPKSQYNEQVHTGYYNDEGSGLVKTSKKHLSLPYFDNYNDPYVFRNK